MKAGAWWDGSGGRGRRVAASTPLYTPGASSFPTRPSCTGIDCPKFTVVNTTDDYEVRYYEAGGLPT